MPRSRKNTRRGRSDVRETLLEWIDSARFVPGDKIPTEQELARTLQKPRHVVRSALLALTAQGLLVRQVGRGTFVATPRDAWSASGEVALPGAPSLAEILEARLAFEPALARLAGARTSPGEIQRLEQCLGAFDMAGSLAELEMAEADFVRALFEAVGNSVLTAMGHVLVSIWRRHAETRNRDLPVTEAQKIEALDAARAVIDALRAFDGPQAERARADALLALMQRFSVLGR